MIYFGNTSIKAAYLGDKPLIDIKLGANSLMKILFSFNFEACILDPTSIDYTEIFDFSESYAQKNGAGRHAIQQIAPNLFSVESGCTTLVLSLHTQYWHCDDYIYYHQPGLLTVSLTSGCAIDLNVDTPVYYIDVETMGSGDHWLILHDSSKLESTVQCNLRSSEDGSFIPILAKTSTAVNIPYLTKNEPVYDIPDRLGGTYDIPYWRYRLPEDISSIALPMGCTLWSGKYDGNTTTIYRKTGASNETEIEFVDFETIEWLSSDERIIIRCHN
jgi:hypothetical protein